MQLWQFPFDLKFFVYTKNIYLDVFVIPFNRYSAEHKIFFAQFQQHTVYMYFCIASIAKYGGLHISCTLLLVQIQPLRNSVFLSAYNPV